MGDVIQPFYPLSPLLLMPSIFPSIRVFSNQLAACIRWPKYWSFSFSSSNECSGLISFRIDWFDLHAVQGTLKSLFQHHNSKASIPHGSAFFMVQLSHLCDYWKNHSFEYTDLCWQSDVSVFSICSLGLSWLFFQGVVSFKFMAVVTILNDFGAQENTVCHCFHFYPIYLPEVLSPNAMILIS